MKKVSDATLVKMAKEAMMSAYAPYSHYYVGAALLCADGKVYTGCNIENASYTPTNCGERTAFFKAISEGERDFVKIAICGGYEGNIEGYFPPCGVCRQVMSEFCHPEKFEIILVGKDETKKMKLTELLPEGFSPSFIK